MNPEVLVLGSEGFIGSALVRALNAKGIAHRAVPCGHQHPRFTLDRNTKWLPELLAGVDTVYCVAGRTGGVGRMARDPLSFVLPNVRIQMNVMEACVKAGVRRYISGQSITGYPDTPEPVREEQYGEEPLHPMYFVPGNTWRFVGKLAEMMAPLECVFLRPSNVYGPRNDFDPQTSHVIEATVRKVYERQDPFIVWGNGEETRDPTYIGDLAEALTLAIDAPPGAYNIGTGQSVSVNEMIAILCKHAGFAPNIQYDASKPSAIQTRYLDCSKAERVLGFKPRVKIEDGLARTYDWFCEQQPKAA